MKIAQEGDETVIHFHYKALKLMFLVLICVVSIGATVIDHYTIKELNPWLFLPSWAVIVFILHSIEVKITVKKDGALVINKKDTIFYNRTFTIKSNQHPYLSSRMSVFDMPKFLAFRVNFSSSPSLLRRIYHPFIFYDTKNKIDLIPKLITLSRNVGEMQLLNEDQMKKVAESMNIPLTLNKSIVPSLKDI